MLLGDRTGDTDGSREAAEDGGLQNKILSGELLVGRQGNRTAGGELGLTFGWRTVGNQLQTAGIQKQRIAS
jgi:hypothetical protein